MLTGEPGIGKSRAIRDLTAGDSTIVGAVTAATKHGKGIVVESRQSPEQGVVVTLLAASGICLLLLPHAGTKPRVFYLT